MILKGKARLVQRKITVLLYKLFHFFYTIVQRAYWELNGTAQKLREAQDPKNYDRCVQVLNIVFHHKFCELQNTDIDEFLCTHVRFENPQFIIDNDDINLMCINDRNAVFVQPKEKGMMCWKAEVNPFIRLAHIVHGKTVFLVPLEAFHRMAETIGDPPKILFLFNTARCGSTLMNQMLECTGRCIAISEPDSLNIIAMKWHLEGDSAQLRQLARDAIRWECRPFKSFQPPPLAYMLKLSSPSGVALPLFRELYPESKCMFMYRGYVKCAQSIFRCTYTWPSLCLMFILGKLSGKMTSKVLESMGYSGKDFSIRLHDDMTFGVLFTATLMKKYLEYRREGIDVKGIRYEDLISRPLESSKAIMEHCELPMSLAEPALEGLKRDSQQNTPISKANIGHLWVPELTPHSKVILNKMLEKYELPTLDEECVLDGTMTYMK
jgi:hypothetical protein